MKQKQNNSFLPVTVYNWIILSLLFSTVLPAAAADIYVDEVTCPLPGSGTSVDPFCSIQYGIDAAIAGDDILVHPGDYYRIIMKSGVNVIDGDSGDEIKPRILAIANEAEALVQFEAGVQNCSLDGFIIDDSGTTSPHALILMEGFSDRPASDPTHSQNLTISNCELSGAESLADSTAKAGISLHGTLQNILISNTSVRNIYGTAIVVGTFLPDTPPLKYSSLTIEANTLENNGGGGLYLRSSRRDWNKVHIKNNTISSDGTLTPDWIPQGHIGIGLINIHRGYDSETNTPKDDVETNAACGLPEANICGAIVEGNVISNLNLTGILLENSWTVTPHLTGNHIFNNDLTGLNIVGSSKVTIIDNEINTNFRSGIAFNSNYLNFTGPSSESVRIENNQIYQNSFAGIGFLDYVTGTVNITGNSLHDNFKSGVAFYNATDDVIIENNSIFDNGTSGIYTGKWYGRLATINRPGPDVMFNRLNGPANLTIRKNKIYRNISGMRIDHASGTISNNLVYDNHLGGIRFSGKNVGGFEPFGVKWGITLVDNNTVSDNGSGDYNAQGAGIIYDNINYTPGDGTVRSFDDGPRMKRMDGILPAPILIENNIATWNYTIGIRGPACCIGFRDYNLMWYNTFWNPHHPNSTNFQTGSCSPNANELGPWNFDSTQPFPIYVDRVNKDYHLVPESFAKGSGSDGTDMGAYGGSDPLDW